MYVAKVYQSISVTVDALQVQWKRRTALLRRPFSVSVGERRLEVVDIDQHGWIYRAYMALGVAVARVEHCI